MSLLIEVTADDIEAGRPNTVCYSPLGLALERTFADGHYDVWPDGAIVSLNRRMWLSTRALRAARRFYRGRSIQPFRFKVNVR